VGRWAWERRYLAPRAAAIQKLNDGKPRSLGPLLLDGYEFRRFEVTKDGVVIQTVFAPGGALDSYLECEATVPGMFWWFHAEP
jgi:hypothetical protein